ncbi:MAG: hypothetical protein ACOCQD_05385, partial [archaeon]
SNWENTKKKWLEFLGIIESDNDTAANFEVQLFEGNNLLNDSCFVNISNVPSMPNIKGMIDANKGTFEMKLEIIDSLYRTYEGERRLVRADESYYPGEHSWQEVESGEKWDVNFGDDFRGGKAYLIGKNSNRSDTIVFFIRGNNPTQAQVQSFTQTLNNGNAWYFVKMMRQESESFGDIFKQFNPGEPGPKNDDAGGRPNWGGPYGWGIMQLDNLGETYGTLTEFNDRYGASTNELWNWQANVRKGVRFFNGEKLTVADSRWEEALEDIEFWEEDNANFEQQAYPMKIIQSLDNTEIDNIYNTMEIGDNDNNEKITSNPKPDENDHRLLRDAFAIKFYNGGPDYFLISIPNTPDSDEPETPMWLIDKTQNGRDYVDEVCGRAGW